MTQKDNAYSGDEPYAGGDEELTPVVPDDSSETGSLWGDFGGSSDTDGTHHESEDDDEDDDTQLGGSHDDENDEDEDEEFVNDDNEDEDISELDDGKKQKKKKAYLLVGSILAATGIVIGGGLFFTGSDSSTMNSVAYSNNTPLENRADNGVLRPLDRSPVDVEVVRAGAAVNEGTQAVNIEQKEPLSDTIVVRADQSYSYEQAPFQDDVEEIKRHSPSELFSEITTLNEKTDLLARGLVKIEGETKKVAEETQKVAAVTEDHAKRIEKLEALVKKGLTPTKPAPAAKPTAKPRATPKPSVEEKANTPTAPKPSIRVREISPTSVAAPSKNNALSAYKVVGVYPSERMGVAPQKAWVTNGESLIEVIVGSTLDGARVTKIANGTVHTNKGAIN